MVVLSVLAIIAILAYNFFGGTMKEARTKWAATKIYNDMRQIEDALALYHNDNGSYPTLTAEPDYNGLQSLVAGGYLKSVPVQLESTVTYALRGFSGSAVWNADGAGSADYILHTATTNITEDICKAINNTYTSVVDIPAPSAASPNVQPLICWNYSGDAANVYRVSKIIEYR